MLTMIAEDPAAGPLEHEGGHVGHRRRAAVGLPCWPGWTTCGWAVTHLYGLTETYGPLAINEWQPDWDSLDPDKRATLRCPAGRRPTLSPARCGCLTSG